MNAYFEKNEYRIPFRNMVYIGDSDTDIPCMKLVNTNGGHSIGVYNDETKDKTKVFRMLEENRIKYFVPANYKENSELEILIKQIIDRTVFNEALQNFHYKCIFEKIEETKNQSEEEQHKEELINQLEESMSFANTHSIIGELEKISTWTENQKNKLAKIALSNTQVRYILSDDDVKKFYETLCQDLDSEAAIAVKEKLIE